MVIRVLVVLATVSDVYDRRGYEESMIIIFTICPFCLTRWYVHWLC